jgi:hypothetical protein
MVKISLRSLAVSAGVALLLLTVFSDLSPERVDLFKDVKAGGEVTVVCVVMQCNHSKTGLILNVMDRSGAVVGVYVPASIMAVPVPIGSAIRVTVTPSENDPTFMFASSVELAS